jgi:hypothetical protein
MWIYYSDIPAVFVLDVMGDIPVVFIMDVVGDILEVLHVGLYEEPPQVVEVTVLPKGLKQNSSTLYHCKLKLFSEYGNLHKQIEMSGTFAKKERTYSLKIYANI